MNSIQSRHSCAGSEHFEERAISKPYNQRMTLVTARPESTWAYRGTLRALLASTRPMSSLLATAMTCAVIAVSAGVSVRCMLAGLAMFALTAFGFQINDILDYRKDVAARVLRPIASGVLSRKAAAVFAFGLLIFALAIGAWIGPGWKILAATAVALIVYTPAAHNVPVIKGLYVAALCIAPLLYGSVVGGAAHSWQPYMLLSAFILGRETLMDANEARGDRSAGMVTIAAMLGAGRARWIGVGLMVLSIADEALIAHGWLAKISAVSALALLLGVLCWPRVDEDKRVELSRLPMLAAALAIACG
jgi:4-hydroxybenzoate polyprenyltransferase